MTRSQKTSSASWKVDALGRLELIGGVVYGSIAFGLLAVRIVSRAADERTPSTSSWQIGAGIGVTFSIAVALLILWSWRRQGGQPVVRLAGRAMRTGELPESRPERTAVLRDLERQRRASEEGMPAVARVVLFSLIAVLNLITEHTLLDVLPWLLIWPPVLLTMARELPERTRRRTRQRLIDRLSEDLIETPEGAEEPHTH